MHRFLFSALVAGVLAVPALAAPIELTASTEGGGVVERNGSGLRVSKANLVLKKDGRFSLGLVGDEDVRFGGTWRATDDDSLLIKLTEVSDRDARGSGQIELRARRGSYELASVALNGEDQRGRTVSVRFRGESPIYLPPPPPPPPAAVLDSERRGGGTLEVNGRLAGRLVQMHVQLLRNGRAHVHSEGGATLRYEGTWQPGGRDSALLNVRGGLDGERLQGVVQFRSGRLGPVDLSGTYNRRYYSLQFVPRP